MNNCEGGRGLSFFMRDESHSFSYKTKDTFVTSLAILTDL